MSAVTPLYTLIGISERLLSKSELCLLEADLLIMIYEELKKILYKQFYEREDMLEGCFLSLIINDILISEEYTIVGISYETGIPQDVLESILIGFNSSPSAELFRKIIELQLRRLF